MGSGDIPSKHEQRAFEIVAAVTGARVEPRDGTGAAPRTPDAELLYADGRRGWLDVNTLGDQAELELAGVLSRHRTEVPSSGRWDWTVAVTRRETFQCAKEIAQKVVLCCEAAGVTGPHLLPEEELRRDAEIQWAAREPSVTFFGIELPSGAHSINPTIRFKADDWIASSRFGETPLVGALETAFEMPPLEKRVRKLQDMDGDERHLYLRVTKEGVGERNMFTLVSYSFDPEEEADEESLQRSFPAGPLLPPGITHLWLDTTWGPRVSRWTHGRGWDHVGARLAQP